MVYFFETIFYFLLGFLYLALMGYPFLKLLFPKDLYQEYGSILVYPVGYLILCFCAFSLSGGTGMSAPNAVRVVSAIFASATLILLIRDHISFSKLLDNIRRGASQSLLLITPIFVIMFWPLFINGSDTYLGAVNPDYFAGLVDNYFLQKGFSVGDFTKGDDTYFPIDFLAGSISSSGRFASGLVGVSLEVLFGLTTREALTISLVLFLACLPITVYFFSRVIMGLDRSSSRVSAWLMCISGPIALSYLYFYLGQNSGLAALPLVLTMGFLALTRPNAKTLALFTLLANALFVSYFGMLPYAIAPLGALWLYLCITKEIKITTLIAMLVGVTLMSLAMNVAMIPAIHSLLLGWGSVIGQTLQGQYFLDFLTEMYFPLYLGSVAYPVQNSTYELVFGQYASTVLVLSTLILAGFLLVTVSRWGRDIVDWRSRSISVSMAIAGYLCVWLACGIPRTHYALIALPFACLVGGFVLFAIFDWIQKNKNNRARFVTITSAILIYAIVWWFYTFEQQYGYAVFKMASWLQFLLIPFIAHGMSLRFNNGPALAQDIKNKALTLCAILFIASNIATTIDYGAKGMGQNTYNGYIVNNFDVSGNRDYFELDQAIREHVGPDQSIGLMFVDSIQNHWVAYYLREHRVSMLSHESMPGDDENLPNIETNLVTDYYGNIREVADMFFHGAKDDFILTWNEGHINEDIVANRFHKPPLWENSTFRLFNANDNPDQVFTGRGFYRTEYYNRPMSWYWPKTMRWSAEGGEIYLLRPSQIGNPYQITFDTIVGLEFPDDSRHIEVYVNGIKIDEVKVTSSARYISAPFIPTEQVTKVVLKIKEKVRPMKRPLPIWNDDIPTDYRQLNAAFSNVSIAPVDQSRPLSDCGTNLIGDAILRCAVSYNGIQVDRWTGEGAEFVIHTSDIGSASELVLEGFVPGNLNFSFPFALNVFVDDVKYSDHIESAGAFSLKFEIPKSKSGKLVSVKIVPSQVHELKGQFRLRRKLVKQSIKLDRVIIK